MGGNTGGQGQGFGGFDFSGFQGGNGQGFEFDLGDIFGDIFGGRNGGGKAKRGRDISVDIEITFSESIFGVERKIVLNKVGTCDTCKGSGGEPGTSFKKCSTCKGEGRIHETKRSIFGNIASTRECNTCSGRGEIPERKCKTCGGDGVVKKNEEMTVKIPAGIENGQMIRVSNRGEAMQSGVSGDLYIRVYVEADKVFRRDGHNLEMNLDIKLTEALLGAERQIKTLDGDLTLTIPTGISSGEILRIRNKGVPTQSGKRGDLLVKIIIKTPTKLSKEAKKLIEGLKEEGM
jgi:molecular chaperone DnaJ